MFRPQPWSRGVIVNLGTVDRHRQRATIDDVDVGTSSRSRTLALTSVA